MDPYSYPNATNTNRTALLRLIIGVALVLMIGFLIVWLIFFRHPNNKNTAASKAAETSQQANQKAAISTKSSGSTGTGTSSSSTTNSSASSAGKTPSSTTGSTSSQSAPASTSQSTTSAATGKTGSSVGNTDLSNTGPGDVIGLVAVAIVAGTVLRRYQLARR